MSRRRAGWWRAWLLAGLLLAVARSLAAAADLGTIYDDATLQAKAADYREVVQWNLDNVFLPQMSPAERRALAGLRLEFPLRGPTRSPSTSWPMRARASCCR